MTSTLPSDNSVAVSNPRAVASEPVAVNVLAPPGNPQNTFRLVTLSELIVPAP